MFRIMVVGGFFLVSVAIVVWSYLVGVNTPTGTVLVNLGTEIFGILITLAVVDWLLERRRLQDRARELSWRILHNVERAVWLWQGGPRRLETDELLGLIAGIGGEDRLEPYTRAQLMSIGGQSREALTREEQAVRTLPGLKEALEDLTSLHALGDEDSAVSVRVVSEVLQSSVRRLAELLGQPTQQMLSGLVRYRDPSPRAQEERFRSLRPEALERPRGEGSWRTGSERDRDPDLA